MFDITLDSVSFSFDKQIVDGKFKIDDLSLSVNEGEFCSVLGGNGSGKTTLLRLMSGFLSANSGKILIKNIEIKKYSRAELSKIIAFVQQINPVVFPYSVFEIVAMGRAPYLTSIRFENANDLNVINKYLQIFELYDLRNKSITQISGGELQRTFICRALVQEPKILIMDEPVSHLDIKHQLASYRILKELNKSLNLTIILVSHDLNMTLKYSDKVILMKLGKVVQYDLPENVLTTTNIKSVFDVQANYIFDADSQKYLIVGE
jgi:iron complex transport system ATP-binding protein